MAQGLIFSNGLELANLVVNSGLLPRSLDNILLLCREVNPNDPQVLRYNIFEEANCTIIAFVASPRWSRSFLQDTSVISSAKLQETYSPVFGSLCAKSNSTFSINSTAVQLFLSLHQDLPHLKSKFHSSNKPFIITGYSFGGWVASLLTLWLLGSIDQPSMRRPLCITFGTALVGHLEFLQRSIWNSCFLNVAAYKDPVPGFFSPLQSAYKPFGTFLMCSESGCTCLEDPDMVSEWLVATRTVCVVDEVPEDEVLINYYRGILGKLELMPISIGTSQLGQLPMSPHRTGMILQLEAAGVRIIEQQQNEAACSWLTKLEKLEETSMVKKNAVLDPSTKLNNMKINMTHLEWYKKTCRTNSKGYYDSYKCGVERREVAVGKYKKRLTDYWISMVTEADQKPQDEGASFRKRWLYAGTNYRRMIEPLEIAKYYSKGSRDYKTKGRSRHFIILEKWLEEAGRPNGNSGLMETNKQNLDDLLTIDSCFWAQVEEALISCNLLKLEGINNEERRSITDKLIQFEVYVLNMLKSFAVSPEIFLDGSTFMQWWKQYQTIVPATHSSEFMGYMRNGTYNKYRSSS